VDLQEVLQEALRVNKTQKSVMNGMQATMVLQDLYVQRVCGQLEGDEDQHKTKKGGKLNMDGCLKLLTQDEIFKGVEDWHKACDEEAEAELKKKEVKVKYDATCETWKVLEVQQKVRNNALLKEWEKDMRKWQEERAQNTIIRDQGGKSPGNLRLRR
jgi:hypothetical protein